MDTRLSSDFSQIAGAGSVYTRLSSDISQNAGIGLVDTQLSSDTSENAGIGLGGSRLSYESSLVNTLPKTKKDKYTAVTEAHKECT